MTLLLSIQQLSKLYGKRKRALDGVSLDIFRGEIIALLGVNGAGKTTLSSLLATLMTKSGGDILWNGESIYRQLTAYRRRVGLCPQYPNIPDNISLEELLCFTGRCYGLSDVQAQKRCDELMKALSLTDYRKAYASHLSGGYKQRFLIARALIHTPDLVILDEPTVGLDPHIRRELWEVIAKLKEEGMTVLLTTHYLDEAEYLADRVCMIHGGQIKAVDTPKNLIGTRKNLEEFFIEFVEGENAGK
ncbi:MAG: ABC transporter ATP-binding protein [Chlamydiales bacterium]|nr:ABC transporter ATP-binding protein [Chlamydiales bacterium]